MKNKIFLVILLIVCLIPSAVAVASYRNTQNAPVDENNAVTISIDDINGRNYTLTKEQEGDEADTLIDYFLGLKQKAQSIVALPDSLMGEKCFHVSLSTSVGKKDSFEFYFSPDPSTNYFVASDGSAYKMDEEDAKTFITTQYAESIYDNSTIPTLTLSGKHVVQPDNGTWQYKNFTGEYVDADVTALVFANEESYELEGGLNLTFDLDPDLCEVDILSSDGRVLYDQTLASLSTFQMEDTGEVNITITAKWYDDPSRTFCGTLEYRFTSFVIAPAEFYLGMAAVESGKFTAITALNVTKPENIQVTSTMETFIQPKFYAIEGNRAVALLPIDPDTPSGLYNLSFTYGSTVQDTMLTVEHPGEKISTYTVPQATVATYRTNAAVEEFVNLTKTLAEKGSSTKHFSGSFLQGPNGNYTLLRGFARDIYLNGSATVTYRNNGVDYQAAAGAEIPAWNAGEVVYAGSLTYTGNIVVVEHGFGLKTWYYNMGSVKVSVGDQVEKGTVIGTAGSTGFTGTTGVHIAMSVGETFVSPYDTWADSPIAAKVIIAKIDE